MFSCSYYNSNFLYYFLHGSGRLIIDHEEKIANSIQNSHPGKISDHEWLLVVLV
jgi:hypothetical protein